MLKKFIAITLALVFCLCAASCASDKEEAPEGMMSATVAGEPFTLYVPKNWTPNTSSGYSSAHHAAIEGLSVSARYSVCKDEKITLPEYVGTRIDSITANYTAEDTAEQFNFELTENITDDTAKVLLGGKDALRFTYKITNNEIRTVCAQITVKHNGDFITLYTYCPEASYDDTRKEILESIRSEFKLGTRTEDKGVELVDKKTPDGMKLASNPDLNYRFFVPKNWICNPEGGATEAYVSESGKPNVTVNAYLPDKTMKLEEYFPFCEESYKTVLPEYSRTEEPTSRKVAGYNALSYSYTTVVEGVAIKINQTVFIHDSSFYSVTYTAIDDKEGYDKYLADVNKMLDSMMFK